jgi:putative DNA-invertase from lambdoid prophage Rac
MPATYAYLRVSTIKQDLETQRYEILKYCERNERSVDIWLEIEISSRKNMKERRIDELLSLLKKGDTVIVSELSRIGRSISQVVLIVEGLIKKHVNFIAIKQNIVLNGKLDMQAKVMVTMFGLFAEMERDLISMRTKAGLANAKAKGVKLGNPNLKSDNRKRIQKANEFAESLRGIVTGLVNYGLTQRQMVDELNRSGLKTERGCGFKLVTVQRVLARLGLSTMLH